MGTHYHQNDMKHFFCFHICSLYDLFNLYEFQEKQNIEYQRGQEAKREDFHDDLRGFQGRNIE